MGSKPGPLCQGRNPVDIKDGTLCTSQSPQPGVQGDRSWLGSVWDGMVDDAIWAAGRARDGAIWIGGEASEAYHYAVGALDAAWKGQIRPMLVRLYHFSQRELTGIWCLIRAREAALKVLQATILEETGYELASMLAGVIEGLIDAMIQIGVITLLGGVIGGAIGAVLGALAGAPAAGVGAIPGAIAGATEGGVVGGEIGFDVGVWYVTIIGLKFLVDALVMGFKEMFVALKNYVTWAWAAKDMGPAMQEAQIQRAGKELARAFGVFMRFVLLALILYVTKKALEFGGGAKGEAEGLEKTTGELSKSGLGARFARWFKEKFPELKKRQKELENRGIKKPPAEEDPTGRNGRPTDRDAKPKARPQESAPKAPPKMSLSQALGDAKANELIKAGKARAAANKIDISNLTDDEVGAIYGYTTNEGYMTLNPALRGQTPMTPEIRAYADHAISGLDKLPASPGTVFRGVNLPDAVGDTYQPGNVVSDGSFLSTSSTSSFPGKYQMTIESVSGRDISGLSQYGNEGEVLFKPGAQFEVLSRTVDPATGTINVLMREVGAP